MARGDIVSVLSVYDPEAVFVAQAGGMTTERDDLRRQLAPPAAARAHFEYKVLQVVETDGIALTHTMWTVSYPQSSWVYGIEVARWQPDGSWRWLIGNPFRVGKHYGGSAGPVGS
jgi:hypothetical protein